jgi:predicted tellurium resistance membrane protein TerC
MSHLLTSESIISFIILVILEIVLGIDNVIFVSIIMSRLKKKSDRKNARIFWMITGILSRCLLLLGLGWLLKQKGITLFEIGDKGFDLAAIVMLAGGLFLMYKSVREIHAKLEGEDLARQNEGGKGISYAQALAQIVLIDAVFSFDSIITAGGTAKHVEIMIAAVVIAMIVMFLFSSGIAAFIHKHPSLKMLALSFLVMIGLSLIIEGWDSEAAHLLHLKNYIYFGMAFSFTVEMLNMKLRKVQMKRVVELNQPRLEESQPRDDQAH